jgi:hypothetical protein
LGETLPFSISSGIDESILQRIDLSGQFYDTIVFIRGLSALVIHPFARVVNLVTMDEGDYILFVFLYIGRSYIFYFRGTIFSPGISAHHDFCRLCSREPSRQAGSSVYTPLNA